MNEKEIKKLAKGYSDTVAEYLCDFLDHEDHSIPMTAYMDTEPLRKLEKAGMVEQDLRNQCWKLTTTGLDMMESVEKAYDAGLIRELPLVFRNHYVNVTLYRLRNKLFNKTVDRTASVFDGLRETAVTDRSPHVRLSIATFLADNRLMDKKTANRLAKDKKPEIRELAAGYADKSLYYDEADVHVVEFLIRHGIADKGCIDHWIKSDDEDIRRNAAKLADDSVIDAVLSTLSPTNAAIVLVDNPKWATGERVERVWKDTGEDAHIRLSQVMRDVPDSLIEEAFGERANWGIWGRMEEYRKALRTVAETERLFAEGSEIKAKMRRRSGLAA